MLELAEVPAPEAGHGQVRVRVRATAVNRADLLQRMGLYPAPPDAPGDILGLELAGEIDAVGPGVHEWAVGDRVYGIAGGGTYAELVVVHARTLAPMPRGMSFVDAAAIPEAFLTAYDAMVEQAGLAPGDAVLVHGVGSGVGTAAVQIASALGATVVGTARSKEKLARAAELGMRHGVLAEGGRFADEVRASLSGRGVDVVLELVGGDYVPESIATMAAGGRLVLVGLMAGTRAEIDLAAVLTRRLVVRGTVLRSRPLEEKILATRVLATRVTPLVESGALRPVVDRVLPLAEVREAHAHVGANRGFGKLVLEL